MTNMQIVARLLIAAFLGGLVGFEREQHGRAAGLRTHILVSLGSCLIMLTSIQIFMSYQGVASVDPSRIAAGVVTGIGFLGAGTIMRFRGSVIGLTTAASIWAVSAVGLAIGGGFYVSGCFTAAIILIALILFGKLERMYLKKYVYKILVIETKSGIAQLEQIRSVLSDNHVFAQDYEFEKTGKGDELLLTATMRLPSVSAADKLISDIMKIPNVTKARWE